MKRRWLEGWQEKAKHSLNILDFLLCKRKCKRGRLPCVEVRKTSNPFIFWRLRPPQCIRLVKYLCPQFPAEQCHSTSSRCADRQKKRRTKTQGQMLGCWYYKSLLWKDGDMGASLRKSCFEALWPMSFSKHCKNKALWTLSPGLTWILAQSTGYTQLGIVPEAGVFV